MNALEKLRKCQRKNKSMICLGLDLDPRKMPQEISRTPKGMYDFLRQVIDSTADLVCAYKPNVAFYENIGPEGLSLLAQLVRRIPDGIPVILDGKRGDIGNTAAQYAECLFDRLGADWVTVNPYMGYDSMRPFVEYEGKGLFVLCLTSNPGHKDFQMIECDGKPLYRIVAEKVAYWNKEGNFGLVVGATVPDQLAELRQVAGDMAILIPGVGAQGGSLEKAAQGGTDNFTRTGVINVCRSVLYASHEPDFAERARQELLKLNGIIDSLRPKKASDDNPTDVASSEETSDSHPDPEAQTSPEEQPGETESGPVAEEEEERPGRPEGD